MGNAVLFDANFIFTETIHWDNYRGGGGGGGGSNNKKDHAAGKNLRCPLSFLFFFVLFQNTFKIDVFVSNLVKNVSSKKNKKDHDFRIFWSLMFFFVVFAGFG